MRSKKYSIDSCYPFDLKGRACNRSTEQQERDAEIIFQILISHLDHRVYARIIDKLKSFGEKDLKEPMNPSRRHQD